MIEYKYHATGQVVSLAEIDHHHQELLNKGLATVVGGEGPESLLAAEPAAVVEVEAPVEPKPTPAAKKARKRKRV